MTRRTGVFLVLLSFPAVAGFTLLACTGSGNGPAIPVDDAADTTMSSDSPVDAPAGDDAPGDTSDTGGDSSSADAADAGLPCEAGKVLCMRTCTDLSSDPLHCGSCDRNCQVGPGCSQGACQVLSLLGGTGTDDPLITSNPTTLFWITQPGFMATVNEVAMQGVLDGAAPMPLATSVWGIAQMAADSNNLYWTQNFINNSATSFAVVQVSIGGGQRQTLSTPSSQLSALAVNSTTVFYTTNNSGTIWSVPIGGGSAATAIVTGQTGTLYALAADDNNVYWANGNNSNMVMQATVAGANAKTIATTAGTVSSLAIDATTVYIASAKDGIYSAPIGGGAMTTLGSYGWPLAVDATDLYFLQQDTNVSRFDMMRMPKAGGTEIVLAGSTLIQPGLATLGPNGFYALSLQNNTTAILFTPK